jgi:hypothetical protein
MSMLTTEWNWDTAKRVWQDEAREEGIGVGLAQGRDVEREEILKLFEQGLSVDEIKGRLKRQ